MLQCYQVSSFSVGSSVKHWAIEMCSKGFRRSEAASLTMIDTGTRAMKEKPQSDTLLLASTPEEEGQYKDAIDV